MKITLKTNAVNGGAFNCQPARTIEMEPERVLCNNVILPGEYNPHHVRLWIIGNEFGSMGAVWAGCEAYALACKEAA